MRNQPRTIPREFRVVEFDDIVWLYDDSSRTYLCTSTPSIWAEPLYYTDDEIADFWEMPDPTYLPVPHSGTVSVPVDPDYLGADVDHDEAWDAAREEAHANHLL